MNFLSTIRYTSRVLDFGSKILHRLPLELLQQRIAPGAALFCTKFDIRKKRRTPGLVKFEKFDEDLLDKITPLIRYMLDKRILFSSYIYDRKYPDLPKRIHKLALYHFMEEIEKIYHEKTTEVDKENDMRKERKYWDYDLKNKFRYENLKREKKESALKEDVKDVFGTEDPSIPASEVPCGGCGAFLHCQQKSQPGFKTSETFVGKSEAELLDSLCQRCHLLKHYGYQLEVDVEQSSYMPMLREVMKPTSLVLLLVDLTDAPCSMHPSIMELINEKQPVIVVGTKLDMLPEDSLYCFSTVKEALMKVIKSTPLSAANVVDTCLVSFTSGQGQVELIEAIEAQLNNERTFSNKVSDVFILGSTNVGKSTLFNLLQNSVLCDMNHKPRQPATVSMFPGTTLQLLKYRIKDSQRRIAERFPHQQVLPSADSSAALTGEGSHQNSSQQAVPEEAAADTKEGAPQNGCQQAAVSSDGSVDGGEGSNTTESSSLFEDTWLFDTPGVLQPDQLLPLLTPDELPLLLTPRTMVPESFRLRVGHSLLVGGLARLDVLHLYHTASTSVGSLPYDHIDVTVFRSDYLPVTIVKTSDAAAVYREYLGSKLLQVPSGSKQRLQHWPTLQSTDLRFSGGKQEAISSADVVLSNAGWLAMRLSPKSTCEVRAWTPHGRGAYVRRQPFLPNTVMRRGPRQQHCLRYGDHSLWFYNYQLDLERNMCKDMEKQLEVAKLQDPRKTYFIE